MTDAFSTSTRIDGQALREALLFEAAVIVLRPLFQQAAAKGLNVKRTRFIIQLAARALERRP